MIKIDGTELPSPSGYHVDIMDLVGNAERNAKGTLFREYIATKYKISMEWGIMTQEDLTNILTKVRAMEFSVTFLDPITGSDITKTFYAGDRGVDLSMLMKQSNLWNGLKVNFTEV